MTTMNIMNNDIYLYSTRTTTTTNNKRNHNNNKQQRFEIIENDTFFNPLETSFTLINYFDNNNKRVEKENRFCKVKRWIQKTVTKCKKSKKENYILTKQQQIERCVNNEFLMNESINP